jgi:type II secretion system protein J
MSRRSHDHLAFRGFTLVELLVAMAISTFVAAAALSVFLTITASQRRQTESRREDALQALDVLRRDVACALPTAFTSAPPFALETAAGNPLADPDGGRADLILTTGRLDDDATDLTRLHVWRVRYRRVSTGPHDATTVLTREAVRLDAPGSEAGTETGILFRGVVSFDVSVLQGATWTNHWMPSSRQPLPKAVRMELGWTEAGTTVTAGAWTVLPAAQAFPAKTKRAAPATAR